MEVFSQLLDHSKVSLGRLEAALQQSCPKAIEWCSRVDAPLKRRALCAAIIENLDRPLRVTFEECIVRRWLPHQNLPVPARFLLEVKPCLDFIESGKVTLQLSISASVELATYSADARVTINSERRELLLPQGAAWKAILRLSIQDQDGETAASEFHAAPQQDIYLPPVMKVA